MLALKIEIKNLGETVQHLVQLPGVFTRARKSALSSVGFYAKKEAEAYIQTGGEGSWPQLHPMTLKLRKTKGRKPLLWLKRFVRYVVNPEASAVEVKLDTRHTTPSQEGAFLSRALERSFGTYDERITPMIERHEYGEQKPVTARMRRAVAQFTKRRALEQYRRPKLGKHYFAFRATTTHLIVPRRPIIQPVYLRLQGLAAGLFEQKFYQALDRYMKA
jgi:hypothetical protein